jgi:TRAP-type C4-dicarboxylate transport system permease small subunit
VLVAVYEKITKFSNYLSKGVEGFSNLCLWVMTIIVMVNIVTRYVLGFSFAWSEEISKLLMVWFTLLIAAVMVFEDKHIAITFIFDRLSVKSRIKTKIFFDVLVIIFSIIVTYSGVIYLMDNYKVTLPASGISRFWLYLPVPIMGVLMFIYGISLIFKGQQQLKGNVPFIEKTWEDEIS